MKSLIIGISVMVSICVFLIINIFRIIKKKDHFEFEYYKVQDELQTLTLDHNNLANQVSTLEACKKTNEGTIEAHKITNAELKKRLGKSCFEVLEHIKENKELKDKLNNPVPAEVDLESLRELSEPDNLVISAWSAENNIDAVQKMIADLKEENVKISRQRDDAVNRYKRFRYLLTSNNYYDLIKTFDQKEYQRHAKKTARNEKGRFAKHEKTIP